MESEELKEPLITILNVQLCAPDEEFRQANDDSFSTQPRILQGL